LSDLSATGSSIGLATWEVVGHLRIELLNGLLLGTGLATTTALSTTASLTTSACGAGGSLLSGRRLGLVLLWLSDTVGKRRWAGGGRDSGGANEHLNSNRATVDLDTIEMGGSLGGLVVLVEDDGGATDAAALGVILEKNLLRATYTNS
jgi:hypothetical protein